MKHQMGVLRVTGGIIFLDTSFFSNVFFLPFLKLS